MDPTYAERLASTVGMVRNERKLAGKAEEGQQKIDNRIPS